MTWWLDPLLAWAKLNVHFPVRDLQRATNDICILPHLARFGAQSMDGLMEQLSAVIQLKSITD